MQESKSPLEIVNTTIKLPEWKWLPGMLCFDEKLRVHWRIVSSKKELLRGVAVENGYVRHAERWFSQAPLNDYDESLERALWSGPDITDPATVGCIRHLAKEVWGNKGIVNGIDSGFTEIINLLNAIERREDWLSR